MPDNFLELFTKYGVTGVMVAMWYLERTERVATQKALQQLIPDGIRAMSEMTNAMRALRFTLFRDNKNGLASEDDGGA
jgi:hypothetical protein